MKAIRQSIIKVQQKQQFLCVFAKVAAAVQVDLTNGTEQLLSLSTNDCRTATRKLVWTD